MLIKILKNNYKYILIFIFTIVLSLLWTNRFYDSITQYGMAHAVRIGEVLYKDINTVSTPLYIIICAIPLLIYDNYLVYIITNSIMFTLMYYFADKMIKNNKLSFFLITLLPLFDIACPSYNLLSKLLIIILIYMEKEKKNNIYIGLILGLLLLTKHSIGLIVIPLSLLYKRNIKDCLYRIIGILIPVILFVIYLLITNTTNHFINLCFLGLKEFNNKNNYIDIVLLIMSIFIVIYYIAYLIRHKSEDNPEIYYGLASISFIIPIIDLNHFSSFFIFFLLFIYTKYTIKLNFNIINISLTVLFIFMIYKSNLASLKYNSIGSYNHFKIYVSSEKNTSKILDAYNNKYKKSRMIDTNGMFYDIVTDKKINYYDVPLTGNYGKEGNKKLINMLENKNYYFIHEEYKDRGVSQFDIEFCEYVINNSKLVDNIGDYNIYYYEEKA